jgi:hypothetical protein
MTHEKEDQVNGPIICGVDGSDSASRESGHGPMAAKRLGGDDEATVMRTRHCRDETRDGRGVPSPRTGRGAQRRRAPAQADADQGGAIMRMFNGRNPFRFLFGSSRREDSLARYVVREHARRRPLAEILDDPYVRNWSTAEERARLLDRPDVVAASGENSPEDLKRTARPAA